MPAGWPPKPSISPEAADYVEELVGRAVADPDPTTLQRPALDVPGTAAAGLARLPGCGPAAAAAYLRALRCKCKMRARLFDQRAATDPNTYDAGHKPKLAVLVAHLVKRSMEDLDLTTRRRRARDAPGAIVAKLAQERGPAAAATYLRALAAECSAHVRVWDKRAIANPDARDTWGRKGRQQSACDRALDAALTEELRVRTFLRERGIKQRTLLMLARELRDPEKNHGLVDDPALRGKLADMTAAAIVLRLRRLEGRR